MTDLPKLALDLDRICADCCHFAPFGRKPGTRGECRKTRQYRQDREKGCERWEGRR